MFSLDPVALENIDKSVDNDDQDNQGVAVGGEEGDQERPPWKIHVVHVVNGYDSICHADAAIQYNNLVQECQGGLFEDHDNYGSI